MTDQIKTTLAASLARFQLAILKFTLRVEESIQLPQFSGSTFRGAFGGMFRRIACAPHCQDVRSCPIASQCPYARIFEAEPTVEGYKQVSDSGLPKPFVFHPPLSGAPVINSGDRLSFHMALIGFAIEYLPYFILTWRELGRVGIGREHGRFRLETVDSCASLDTDEERMIESRQSGGHRQRTIYSSTDEMVRNCLETLTAERLLAINSRLRQVSAAPARRPGLLMIELLTPTRLKSGGRVIQSEIPFGVLIGALLRRLESLSFFYCGGSLSLDYREMLARAKEVQVVSSNLRWVEWERYSRRQDRKIPWGGVLGCMGYSGDFTTFLPFLALGEMVGIGNNCAFGLGRYKVAVTQ